MKKLISALVCLSLMLGLTACGDTNNGATSNAGNDTAFDTGEGSGSADGGGNELPRYKIIYMYSNFTDKLGTQLKSSMEYIAEGMNVEFVFIESGYGEAANAAMEAAVAAGGIDGIVMSQAASVGILNATGGIPVISVSNAPASEEEAAEAATYSNYLGCVIDNNAEAGRQAAQALYAAGCRNVTLAGLTQGMTASADQRAQAFLQEVGVQDDMTLLAEDYSRGLFADAVSSFAAAFPNMDGMFSTSGNDAVLNSMQTEGLVGSVKLAVVDVSSETGTYFDNGTLVWCAGGQYGTAMIGFAILYNYLADGTIIIEDTTVPMERQFLAIESSDDFEIYIKAVDSGIPVYTSDELKQMIHFYNNDVDYDYFVAVNDAYSLDDIFSRHEALLG